MLEFHVLCVFLDSKFEFTLENCRNRRPTFTLFIVYIPCYCFSGSLKFGSVIPNSNWDRLRGAMVARQTSNLKVPGSNPGVDSYFLSEFACNK